ncbi:MAG TPA: HAD family hydrolase [Acidimicrobiales bacterium]|nr:HAD family hydrolase [Acidimicrobiales bacterium]
MDAYVFDFDGLIIDTEWTEYHSICEEFARVGLDFDLVAWQACVGTAWTVAWLDELDQRAPGLVDRDVVTARRRARKLALNDELAILPGVMNRIAEAGAHGLGLAIASSSPRTWVDPHLDRLGLREHFGVVVTRDDVASAKPAPDLYLAAVAALGVEPRRAVAFEDSHNGCLAAKAAGLYCVAVPNPITATQDFSHADLVAGSLDEIDLPLLRRLDV